MSVPVMDIWVVRVSVFARLVNVRMRMWFLPVPFGAMLMLVMLVMNMRVVVLHVDVPM